MNKVWNMGLSSSFSFSEVFFLLMVLIVSSSSPSSSPSPNNDSPSNYAPIYYFAKNQLSKKMFGNFYLANEMRYIDLDFNLRSSICNCNSNIICKSNDTSFNNLFQSHYFLQTNYVLQTNQFLFDCLFVCLENLAVQPNSEKPGSPNSHTNKKIFLSSYICIELTKMCFSY